ncbi:MAG: response regulator transcription factor [Steroidobacteraceae bacterium]
MIRVALIMEAGRLRDDLRAIVRKSERLQAEPRVAAHADLESFGLGAADVIVFDDSPASLQRAQLAHAAGVPIVVMTDDFEVAASLRELRSALALLPTSATAEEIVAAIEAANAGLFVAHADLFCDEGSPVAATAGTLLEPLTPREMEVLHALAAGLGNKTIAAQLHISEHTAKFHVSQILAKLDAGSRAEAVSIAMRRGLLPL